MSLEIRDSRIIGNAEMLLGFVFFFSDPMGFITMKHHRFFGIIFLRNLWKSILETSRKSKLTESRKTQNSPFQLIKVFFFRDDWDKPMMDPWD